MQTTFSFQLISTGLHFLLYLSPAVPTCGSRAPSSRGVQPVGARRPAAPKWPAHAAMVACLRRAGFGHLAPGIPDLARLELRLRRTQTDTGRRCRRASLLSRAYELRQSRGCLSDIPTGLLSRAYELRQSRGCLSDILTGRRTHDAVLSIQKPVVKCPDSFHSSRIREMVGHCWKWKLAVCRLAHGCSETGLGLVCCCDIATPTRLVQQPSE